MSCSRAARGALLTAATAVFLIQTPLAQAVSTTIMLNPSAGPPTSSLTVGGRGFAPSEPVEVTFDGAPLAQAHTNPPGSFTASVVVPAGALPGAHTVVATGRGSGLQASAPFTVRTEWTQFHFDPSRSGLNPYENVLSPANVGNLSLRWTFRAPGLGVSSPVLSGGLVYVGVIGVGVSDAWVVALDAATGARLWTRQTYGGVIQGLAVAGGMVYAATLTGHSVIAYDARTGTRRWTFASGGAMSAPAVVGGVVYSNSNDGNLYAIDALTGAQVWSAATIGGTSVAAPAVSGGVVYAANGDYRRVKAFDSATGELIWSRGLGETVFSTPAVVDGTLYIGSFDDNLYALDAATGAIRWKAPTGGNVESSPAVAGGVVYVGSDDSHLYAFDTSSGGQIWSAPLRDASQLDSPAVANGVVYMGDVSGSVYAFDARTGTQLWSFQANGGSNQSPVVADGVFYFGASDQHLYSFALP